MCFWSFFWSLAIVGNTTYLIWQSIILDVPQKGICVLWPILLNVIFIQSWLSTFSVVSDCFKLIRYMQSALNWGGQVHKIVHKHIKKNVSKYYPFFQCTVQEYSSVCRHSLCIGGMHDSNFFSLLKSLIRFIVFICLFVFKSGILYKNLNPATCRLLPNFLHLQSLF